MNNPEPATSFLEACFFLFLGDALFLGSAYYLITRSRSLRKFAKIAIKKGELSAEEYRSLPKFSWRFYFFFEHREVVKKDIGIFGCTAYYWLFVSYVFTLGGYVLVWMAIETTIRAIIRGF